MKAPSTTLWTFAITSVALFMVTLDNLVVTTALPVIRRDLHASLQGLEWTVNAYTLAMPIFIAPIAGALSDKIAGRSIMALGLALQAIGLGWIALVSTPTVPYADLVAPFVISGVGMGLFFAPVANVVLGAVRPEEEGQASGANNAIRELGGVFGVAVLASIFSTYGGYGTGLTFVAGLTPALWVGAALVAVAAVAALLIPRRRKARVEAELGPELQAAAWMEFPNTSRASSISRSSAAH